MSGEIVRPGEGSPFEQVFSYGDHPVRVIDINGEPWFVALDVCTVLDIRNSRDAVAGLDDDERGVATTDTPGGQQEVVIVNEAGLYSLIFRSRKASAKTFKRWVTHEVLPAIRRGGSYAVEARPASQLDILAGAIAELQRVEQEMRETRDEVRAIGTRTDEAIATVTQIAARQDAIEGKHDWFAGLGYARLQNWSTDRKFLQRLGTRAGRIGRAAGLKVSKVQHGLYGEVNQWPAWCWEAAYEELGETA